VLRRTTAPAEIPPILVRRLEIDPAAFTVR
jgi:hypothetical protein